MVLGTVLLEDTHIRRSGQWGSTDELRKKNSNRKKKRIFNTLATTPNKASLTIFLDNTWKIVFTHYLLSKWTNQLLLIELANTKIQCLTHSYGRLTNIHIVVDYPMRILFVYNSILPHCNFIKFLLGLHHWIPNPIFLQHRAKYNTFNLTIIFYRFTYMHISFIWYI